MAASDPNRFTVDAVLCDSAVVADGKLFVQGGGWDRIVASSFPFRHPRIALAITISVPYVATNRSHLLTVTFESDDGPIPLGQTVGPDGVKPLRGTGAQFNMGRPPTIVEGDRQTVAMAMNFDAVAFERPGNYSFVIAIDDEEVNRLTFRAASPPGITLQARG